MSRFIVTKNEYLTPTVRILTLESKPGEAPFGFQPGQYVTISFKHRNRPTPARCFSIVSSPTDLGTLQISFRIKGRFTQAACDLKRGDEVKVWGPFGSFTMDLSKERKIVMLAGGIGIAPFMSMIQFVTRMGHGAKITLIYGCGNQDDVPFLDQLYALEKHNPNLRIAFAIGDGKTDKILSKNKYGGRINIDMIEEMVGSDHLGEQTYFICGPSGFISTALAILRAKNTPHHKIITEIFSQNINRQSEAPKRWPYSVYALSSLGVVLGSLIIMSADLLSKLPSSGIDYPTPVNGGGDYFLSNIRQSELDKTVNGVPAGPSVVVSSGSPARNAGVGISPASTPANPVSPATKPAATPPVQKPIPTPRTTVS